MRKVARIIAVNTMVETFAPISSAVQSEDILILEWKTTQKYADALLGKNAPHHQPIVQHTFLTPIFHHHRLRNLNQQQVFPHRNTHQTDLQHTDQRIVQLRKRQTKKRL